MSRPSLAEGAIRPGGDPHENIESPRCRQNGADMAVDDDNTVRIADHEFASNNRHSCNFPTENNEGSEEIVYKLLEASLAKRTASGSVGEQLWTDIRQWLSDHPEQEDRHTAATVTGVFSTVSLHLLCKYSDPPLDVVMDLIESAPEAATCVDDHGWLPLHYACAQGVAEDVLNVLIKNNPLAVSKQDKRQRTPLHFAFFKSQSENNVTTSTEEEKNRLSKTVEVLTISDNDVAQIVDEDGRLPLHFAAAYGSSIVALKGLVEAYPESVNAKENLGRTPLHYVMANAHGTMSPSTLQFLLKCPNNSTIHVTDIRGNLPLHLLSERAAKYTPLGDSPSRQNVETCLNMLLNVKPPPDPVPEFFTALQSLPRWLRDRVVTNTYVQDILYKHVSKRFPTMIQLMDYYCYAIIIYCFHYASRSHIISEGTELLPHTTGSIVACVIGTSYFLVREILDVISMISLGTSQSWFFDLTSWFDILVIGLVYYYCGAMILREQDLDLADNFRTGAVLTLGALWIAFINYMRKSSMEVAVFFEAMHCVTRHLSVFLMALIGFLIFFAQMFVVVFRETPVCSDSCNVEGEFPHCNFQDSLMKVYTMMVGEIGDINRYQGHLLAQVIYLAFALLVIILLSNVLIAIVAESHSVIKNERAEILFWSNRLYFVSEINAVSSLGRSLINQLTCLYCCVQTHAHTDATTHEDQAPTNVSNHSDHANSYDHAYYTEEETRQGLFRDVWHELILYVREDFLEDPALCEFLLSLFLRCLVCVVLIPLWLLLGAITAGCLWPPQVREWLHASYRLSSPSCSVLGNQMDPDIHSLAQNITEICNEMTQNLGRVRKDIEDERVNMEEFTKDCETDLSELKEALSCLLEVYEADAETDQ